MSAEDGRLGGARLLLTRSASLGLREVLVDEVPVDELVEERLHPDGTQVLVVEVVGVLPHVHHEERRDAGGRRHLGVGRAHDLELAVVRDQPGPAGAEPADGRGLEVLDELVAGEVGLLLVPAAERGGDLLGDGARRRAAAARLHAVPEEGVVPHLRRVVEHRLLVRLAGHGHDHVLEALVREVGAVHQLVQGVDVGLVVLAVVEADRARGVVRLQRVFRVRERRQFERHRSSCGREVAVTGRCYGRRPVGGVTRRLRWRRPARARGTCAGRAPSSSIRGASAA